MKTANRISPALFSHAAVIPNGTVTEIEAASDGIAYVVYTKL